MDKIDFKIIELLQKDGRISNVELGRRTGLTPPPTLRRVRMLEERGIIQGYHARLNKHFFGCDKEYLVEVSLIKTDEEAYRQFEDMCASLDCVQECFLISASHADYIIRVITSSNNAYKALMEKHFSSLVVKFKTYPITTSLEKTGIPLGEKEIPLWHTKRRAKGNVLEVGAYA